MHNPCSPIILLVLSRNGKNLFSLDRTELPFRDNPQSFVIFDVVL